MNDDDDLTDVDDTAAPRTRKQRGLDSLALRELRRAHKLFKEGGTSAEEANFLVASAGVLATLELASALRESPRMSAD